MDACFLAWAHHTRSNAEAARVAWIASDEYWRRKPQSPIALNVGRLLETFDEDEDPFIGATLEPVAPLPAASPLKRACFSLFRYTWYDLLL